MSNVNHILEPDSCNVVKCQDGNTCNLGFINKAQIKPCENNCETVYILVEKDDPPKRGKIQYLLAFNYFLCKNSYS